MSGSEFVRWQWRGGLSDPHAFDDRHDAREKLEAWRQGYNACRPHESLGWLTPEEHAANLASGSALRAAPPATLALTSDTDF